MRTRHHVSFIQNWFSFFFFSRDPSSFMLANKYTIIQYFIFEIKKEKEIYRFTKKRKKKILIARHLQYMYIYFMSNVCMNVYWELLYGRQG